jgi:hypothetical protein
MEEWEPRDYGKYGYDSLTHAKSVLISPPDVAIDQAPAMKESSTVVEPVRRDRAPGSQSFRRGERAAWAVAIISSEACSADEPGFRLNSSNIRLSRAVRHS